MDSTRPSGAISTPMAVVLSLCVVSAAVFFAFTLPAFRGREKPPTAASGDVVGGGTTTSPGTTRDRADTSITEEGADGSGRKSHQSTAITEPSKAMENLAKELLAGHTEAFLDLTGPELVTPRVMKKLEALFGPDGYQIDPASPLGELGRQQDLQRWAINLRHRVNPDNKAHIELDFTRQADGSWKPSALRLPGDGAEPTGELIADTMAIDTALAFVNAVINQDFAAARKQVDESKVGDATIAGLCIIFEESAFTLKKDKPLVATVAKNDVAWFLAQVQGKEPGSDSRFGIVVQREPGKAWRITEVNLDRLLAAHAGRFAEGDVYFTPIVRNPQGGDSIVLYFAYDSDQLHPRTRRQIEIVAKVLNAEAGRKLRISGHTDARGKDDYNSELSRARAEAVRVTMEGFGVPAENISIEGFGASKPRRENFNPDGTDNPEGRRVNRRAEIFLNF